MINMGMGEEVYEGSRAVYEASGQMQENMQKGQDDLASMLVTGESGGGKVKVTMTCKHDVHRLEIEDNLLKDDKEMLEDLIAAAFNDAIRKVEQTVQEKLSGLTGGFSLPLDEVADLTTEYHVPGLFPVVSATH
ncbi:MAG: hypothetical protein CM1200mP36_10620 [Gammaproteobacteria bacterium]|nr:MAG: hypothetical protein CM1200mP36_10620 [Gammaproteobacteria bacterium]